MKVKAPDQASAKKSDASESKEKEREADRLKVQERQKEIEKDALHFKSLMKDGERLASRKDATGGSGEELAGLFKSMSEKSSDRKGARGESEAAQEYAPGTPLTGDALLQSMLSRPGSGFGTSVGDGQTPHSVSEVAKEIAEKIMVSDPTSSGKAEVRISLRESLLQGTEVRISKESGIVQVELVTNSDSSFDFLKGERDNLERILLSRLRDDVSVDVRLRDSGREEGEGRSRQQRYVEEEQED